MKRHSLKITQSLQ